MKEIIETLESIKKFYKVRPNESEAITKAEEAIVTLSNIAESINTLPYDYERNYMNRKYVILEDVLNVIEREKND